MLLRPALETIGQGEPIGVRATHPSVEHDLRAWCRVMGHRWLGLSPSGAYLFEKGPHAELGGADWGVRIPPRKDGDLETRDWMLGRVADIPATADTTAGFAPRGAVVEPGVPPFHFTINERDAVWAAEVADLYEQATASQWDASKDIPWSALTPLPDAIERAICQLMTFLAENEYSALYVPAKFVPQINPRFAEVVMFLSTQMMDEARHIEAFTKRALANGGGLQYSALSTQLSLKSLFDQHDFTTASFLLSVMGEGTFLDLLKFIEAHAPDPATAEICRRARIDESRHVRFGIAHVKWYLTAAQENAEKLMAAVRQRAEYMRSVTEVSPRIVEALALLAAGALEADRLPAGFEKVRVLLHEMNDHRVKRLVACGFSGEQAAEMSQMHTPNFM